LNLHVHGTAIGKTLLNARDIQNVIDLKQFSLVSICPQPHPNSNMLEIKTPIILTTDCSSHLIMHTASIY
jgi:hypothetical protein